MKTKTLLPLILLTGIPVSQATELANNIHLYGRVHFEAVSQKDADFNIVNSSLAELATKRLQPGNDLTVKSIRFQQNKRVRSNEIHYFDHPYMGMIVQIRRHEQSEPELEEESVNNETSE